MKNSKALLLGLAGLGLAVTAAFAQQTKQTQAGTESADALRKHVTYLASDELEGRSPGSSGGNKAAQYIAKQFQDLRLGCATPDLKCTHSGQTRNGYFQELPFVASVELAKNNSLGIVSESLSKEPAVRDSWMPIGYSSNGTIGATPLVFAGYGITSTELKHDDYGNIAARDKIVVVFTGTPDGDNPHGKFAQFADSRWKAIAAKDHGAKALIVIATTEKFADERLAQLRYDQTSGEAGLPVIVVSRQTAASLFGASVPQLNELEKAPQNWNVAAGRLNGVSAKVSVDITRRTVPAFNVVGVLEGSDPKLKSEYIVLGAHYDHLGHGGDSSLAPNSHDIHHGADDNASGTAALIELARILSVERRQLRRSIVFAAFTAEESGLIGSKAYVNKPPVPLAQTIAMLNMDMVGRLRDRKLNVGGIGTSPEFRKLVETLNKDTFALQLNEDGFGPSDHSSFYSKQIPVLFFFTGSHEDYHKPSDTADKINYDGEAKIVNFVGEIARAIDRTDARPTYVLAKSEAQGRSTGFRVYLGTVPNYAESEDGMLLDAVREDSPASKAGLKGGDKIVKLAGRDIKNVYDYTYALGEMRGEQEYEVEVMRNGERLKLKLTPQSRR
jgi:aminopeptidase YwaD